MDTAPAGLGLVTFGVPLDLPPIGIGPAWHPRHVADPAHAWLRGRVRELMITDGPGAGAVAGEESTVRQGDF